MNVMVVYVTASDPAEARRIARVAVEERLAACANILAPMTSIYWWESAVQESSEAVLILKTTADRVAPLMARVKELHSYDVPCIEAWPVADGHPAFLDWVGRETHASPASAPGGLSPGG
jgi:periplasmic divalent cation tolerance protein